MENRNTYGFSPIGVVKAKKEADRIRGLGQIPKGKCHYPLDHAYEFEGDHVPKFIAKELPDISGKSLEELSSI